MAQAARVTWLQDIDDPAFHREGFALFAEYEALTGGPDPHMDMVVRALRGLPDEEQWWRIGCYVGVYNTATAEAIWRHWPFSRFTAESAQFHSWLTAEWAGLRMRPERKAVRSARNLAAFFESYHGWVREHLVGDLRGATYDQLWEAAQAIKFVGRYAATKLLETLRRAGYINAGMSDIRPAGGGGWSPRAGLALLLPAHRALLTEAGDSPDVCREVNALAEEERVRWGLSHFVFEVLLCEYKECAVTMRQYPGRSHDSELGYAAKIGPHWTGRYESDWPAIRRDMFPHWALGELNGWTGPRKELGQCWRHHGIMWSDSLYDYGSTVFLGAPSVKEGQ